MEINKVFEAEVIDVEPTKSNKPKTEVVRIMKEDGFIDLSALSEKDKEKYNKLSKSLNVKDINTISNYGVELQSTMTKYSSDFLSSVRSQQSGEIGGLINDLLGELQYIDVDELKEPNALIKFVRKIPILKNLVSSVNKILTKYDSIEKNVDTISQKIAMTRLSALKDNNALNIMFKNNVEYGKQIEELIIAGKLKLKAIDDELSVMEANPNNYEAIQIQDMQEFKHNLERRLNDMMTLRYVIMQSFPQIRTVQYNNLAIADKANSIITTTIPVWKNQLSIAVALNNQKANIEAQRKVADTTNTILRKNAEMLKQNSVMVAEENERSIIDIETLRETTTSLIETIKEVKQKHDEGAVRRKEMESEITRLQNELENNMTVATATGLLE